MAIWRAASTHLRRLGMAWFIAAFLPLPALLTIDPETNAQLASLYLGGSSAWMAAEIFRSDGHRPNAEGDAKALALFIALFANLTLFIALGSSVGIKSNIPFVLMASLSVTPALGLVPWLAIRIAQGHTAIFLAAVVVAAAKLAACVVARVAYGPDYVEQGYVAADWRTAKLMISIFWSLTVGLSLAAFVADRFRFHRRGEPPSTVA